MIDKGKMFQELLDAARPLSRDDFPQPNITVVEYAELEGVTPKVAYDHLERAVREGKLERQKDIIVNSRRTSVYWKVERDVSSR
jgi:hypothetical protein